MLTSTHSFNGNYVQFIGINSSIIYQQIDTAAKMLPNHALNTSLKQLHKAMPYLLKAEILKSLFLLHELTIIAFEFTDSNKNEIRLVSLNSVEDVFSEDNDFEHLFDEDGNLS